MLRIGIVGAGAIGRGHKAAIEQNPDCRITAICDLAIEKARELAEGTDANIYTDYKEMQEKEQLDGVILNLPHFLHKDVTVFFLEHKIPTLIEKPMANSVEECEEMIEASKKYNTPLGVGHVQKYFRCHKYLRQIIKENKLGKLCAITETRNVNYFPNRPKWFLDKKQAGGGILMNYGAHTLDKIFYITGLGVESVYAAGNNFLTDDSVEASAQVLLRLSDGSSATLNYCGCHIPGQYENYYYFTDGAVKIEGCNDMYVAYGANPLEKVKVPGDDDIMGEQITEFVKMINGEENELVTPEYGKAVIDVLEKAFAQF